MRDDRSLIDSLYELPGRLDLWPEFIATLRRRFDGVTAVCSYGGPDGIGAFAIDGDIDAIRVFNAYYGPTCPWNYPWFATAAEGVVGSDLEMLPHGELVGSEFHNDWQRPFQHRHLLVGVVRKKGLEMQSGLGVWRPPNAPFGDRDRHLMEMLVPHTQRILYLHEQLGSLRAQTAQASDAFQSLPVGVVSLDANGHVVEMNAEARRVVASRDGLTVDRSELRGSDARSTTHLRLTLFAVLQTARGKRLASGGWIAIPRPSMKRPYMLCVAPLGSSHYAPLGSRAAAVVFMTDPERRPQSCDRLLQHLFGLTAREATLACELAAGHSLEAAAAKLAISRNTARTHLKGVFRKTGVQRQTALVLLVSALSPAIPPTF